MTSMLGYLCVGGIEVANPARTLAYMWTLGNRCQPTPPRLDTCCICPSWYPAIDSDATLVDPASIGVGDEIVTTPGDSSAAVDLIGFTTPAGDDAPWYDPGVPESADVLGVWIEEARLGQVHQRQARNARRGTSLSPPQLIGREIQLAGYVYTRTEAATWYARQWLFEALAGPAQDCTDDSRDAIVYLFCDPARPDAGKRTVKRVGLTAFDPEIEPDYPRGCGFKFTATLIAKVPETFHDPTPALLPVDVSAVEPICNFCNPCASTTAACTCGASALDAPNISAGSSASLFCEPLQILRSYAAIDPPDYWREATAIVTVRAGSWLTAIGREEPNPGLANLRIRGYANPQQLTDPAAFVCRDPCIDIEVACVPQRATLTIDGTTRRAWVTCDQVDQNAYAYLTSADGRAFVWPDVSCSGLFLVIDADASATAPGSTVAIDVVQRERS